VENWSGYLPEDGNYRGFLMKYFTRKAFASASKIYHVSSRQKEAILGHGLNGNFELIHNVVDTKIFRPVAGEKKSPVTFLHVSSLVEKEKNILGMLRVIKRLQENGFQFTLNILGGKSDLTAKYSKFSEDLQIDNVFFLGEQSPTTVAQFMQESSALLLFSNYEGMPVVVLEALACGLPVFSTKVGQLPHIISPNFGRLVEAGNEDEFYNVLVSFLKGEYNFSSREMADYISKHASYEAVGKQLSNYYLEIMKGSTNTHNSSN
jgi:L-malate glycosyltransferase